MNHLSDERIKEIAKAVREAHPPGLPSYAVELARRIEDEVLLSLATKLGRLRQPEDTNAFRNYATWNAAVSACIAGLTFEPKARKFPRPTGSTFL